MRALPVISQPPTIRSSKSGRRRAAVLIAVHLLIALHIAHWWLTGSTFSPLEPSEAMELAKHGVVNAGAIFFAAVILLTALFGRFFCGWACHLVALQDLCRWLLARVGIRPHPLRSRLLRWVPLVAFTYMFLWPVAYRFWRGDDLRVRHVELTTSEFWVIFPGWGVALATFFICGFVTIYFLGAKGFCTYACPYGAIFGLADQLAPGRIRVTDTCEGCGHCTAVCSSNVRVHEEVRTFGMVTDPGCMKCMDCVSVCPNDALYFGFGRPAVGAEPQAEAPEPSRRRELPLWEEILLGVSFALAFFAFRGLYGVVPFLFALGVAAILSFLCLQTARLTYQPNLTLRRWALKRAGRLRPAGIVFSLAMALVGVFWVHAAKMQIEARRGIVGEVPSPERYQRMIAADPTAAASYVGLGLYHVELGDLASAGAVFERGLAAGARAAELSYNAGLVDAMTGRPERAIARFEDALAIDSGYLEARENLAGMLCGVGRYREGLAHYRVAVEQVPGDASTYLLMARAHLALGETAAAEPLLARVVELDPAAAEARRLLVELHRSLESGPGR